LHDGSLVGHADTQAPEIYTTPLDAAAGFAVDSLNAIASWGLAGIQFINTDATLSLARAPAGDGIGLLATHVSTGQGVLSASAAIFDRIGSLGVATVTSISHGSTVDPRLWAPVDE
jgi:hypothetical protein